MSWLDKAREEIKLQITVALQVYGIMVQEVNNCMPCSPAREHSFIICHAPDGVTEEHKARLAKIWRSYRIMVQKVPSNWPTAGADNYHILCDDVDLQQEREERDYSTWESKLMNY